MSEGDSSSCSAAGTCETPPVVELEAINLVRFNEQGQIVEFTVFVRPLAALATLFAALPPRVSARRRGRLRGALVAFLTRPLAFALRTADRLTPRFL
jgi:hypothetical protein